MTFKRNNIPIAVFLLFVLFRPMITSMIPGITTLFYLLSTVIALAGLGGWVIKGFRMDQWVLWSGVFFGFLCFSTICFLGEFSLVTDEVRLFGQVLAIRWVCRRRRYDFLTIMRYMMFVLVAFNLEMMVLNPWGLYQTYSGSSEWYINEQFGWVFGGKNAMFLPLFLANLLAQLDLYSRSSGKISKIIDIATVAITVATGFMSGSSTTIIAIVFLSLFPVINLFCLKDFAKKLTSPYVLIAGYVGFTVLLIAFTNLSVFSLVAGIFSKDASFSTRTTAWSRTITYFLDSPLIGYGLLSANRMRELLGAYSFLNAHNTLLQIMMNGGLIGGAVYLYTLFIMCRKIRRIPDQYNAQRFLLAFAFVALILELSMEDHSSNFRLWNMLTMMYYSADLIQLEGKAPEK